MYASAYAVRESCMLAIGMIVLRAGRSDEYARRYSSSNINAEVGEA
jgi:hypothetical protein